MVWSFGWLPACWSPPGGWASPDPAARSPGGEEVSTLLDTDTAGLDSGGALPDAERDAIPEGIVGVERLDASGTRKVFVRRLPGELFTELVVAELGQLGWSEEVRVAGTPNPDRPAISPEGDTIAFVTGVSGVASVWIMPFGGGENPTQITNVGVEGSKRAPGSPPSDFVPPPLAADGLVFAGDWIGWEGPEGPVTVRWR